ncbi:hypothetical protein ACETU7_25140 [Rhodococcus sp. 3Y1]
MKKVLLLTADADNGLGTAIRDAVRGEAEVVRLPERTTGRSVRSCRHATSWWGTGW